jgi:hypothetical protein
MADAADIHGVVFKNGSAILLARLVGADGTPIVRSDLIRAVYTIALLDETDPNAASPVTGHTGVEVPVAAVLSDSLRRDALWDVDSSGYNFRHILDVSTATAFAIAGRSYRVTFELTPAAGPVILVRFRVHAI